MSIILKSFYLDHLKVLLKVKESLVLVKEKVDHENSGWDMVHEDGEMRVTFYGHIFNRVYILPQ